MLTVKVLSPDKTVMGKADGINGPEKNLWEKSVGSGLGYLDYFGKMVQCQVSKCSLLVPSTDGCRRRRGIETMQAEVGYTTCAVDE
jgi:hypothetical protein